MAKWTGQENCKEGPIIPAFTGEYAQFFFFNVPFSGLYDIIFCTLEILLYIKFYVCF